MYGITFEVDSNGVITANGTVQGESTTLYNAIGVGVGLEENGFYLPKGNYIAIMELDKAPTGNNPMIRFHCDYFDGGTLLGWVFGTSGTLYSPSESHTSLIGYTNFTWDHDEYKIKPWISMQYGTTCDNIKIKLSIKKAGNNLNYVPPTGSVFDYRSTYQIMKHGNGQKNMFDYERSKYLLVNKDGAWTYDPSIYSDNGFKLTMGSNGQTYTIWYNQCNESNLFYPSRNNGPWFNDFDIRVNGHETIIFSCEILTTIPDGIDAYINIYEYDSSYSIEIRRNYCKCVKGYNEVSITTANDNARIYFECVIMSEANTNIGTEVTFANVMVRYAGTTPEYEPFCRSNTQLTKDVEVIRGVSRSVLSDGNANFTAATHNALYRGRNITKYFTDKSIYSRVVDYSYEDIYPGDYFDIPYPTSIDGVDCNMQRVAVAACGWLSEYVNSNVGIRGNIMLIPWIGRRLCSSQWDSSGSTANGYKGSTINSILDANSNWTTALQDIFGIHLLSWTDHMSTSNTNNNWGVQNTYWRIMTSYMRFGWSISANNSNVVFSNTGLWSNQLPVFMFNQRQQGGMNIWLSDIVSDNAAAISYSSTTIGADSVSSTHAVFPFWFID